MRCSWSLGPHGMGRRQGHHQAVTTRPGHHRRGHDHDLRLRRLRPRRSAGNRRGGAPVSRWRCCWTPASCAPSSSRPPWTCSAGRTGRLPAWLDCIFPRTCRSSPPGWRPPGQPARKVTPGKTARWQPPTPALEAAGAGGSSPSPAKHKLVARARYPSFGVPGFFSVEIVMAGATRWCGRRRWRRCRSGT